MSTTKPIDQVSFKALYVAWQACQKRKAGTPAAQRYEMQLLDRLFATQQALQSGRYHTTASYCFVTTQPKLREIHAAAFGDRVVHHLLVNQLERLWEPWFIDPVYSNRKHKGTHKAVKQLQVWMRKPKCNYYLQLDIHNFFYSIQHAVLLDFLNKGLLKACKQQKISSSEQGFLSDLCKTFVQADFSRSVALNAYLAQKVPPHKQLGKQPLGQGLPIGNLTSQFFANVYLNALDQFIKHQLKCKYYLRFVDDFVLLANCPKQLNLWQVQISGFLQQQLGLQLKEKVVLKPVPLGADFLGYIVKPHYLLVRKRVINHLHQKLNRFKKQLLESLNKNVLRVDYGLIEKVNATLASYIGHFKHAHSLKLINQLWQQHHWLALFFEFKAESYQLELKIRAPKGANYPQQIQFFAQHYPHALLKVHYGRYQKTYMAMQKQPNAICLQLVIVQAGYSKHGRRRRQVESMQLSQHTIKQLRTGAGLCVF